MNTPHLIVVTAALCGSAHAQTLADTVNVVALPVPGDAWVWAGSPPGDRSRLFALEGGGTIRVLDILPPAAPGGAPLFALRGAPFATVTSAQARSVAFAPDFATSGLFYIAFQAPSGGSQIVEMRASAADPNVADPASLRLIRQFPGLTFDHALGSMHFGADGMLYIGVGDAFNSDNSQRLDTVHGKLLRIDPRSDGFADDPARNYAIPAGNPLIGRPGAAEEVWHIGLRNPWRWSFDIWNHDLWIADVGGGIPGEVNHVPAGGPSYLNFGWPAFDGVNALSGAIHPDFTPQTLTAPVLHVARTGNQCSTSGGVRYRGHQVRAWRGRYVFGDACSRQVYSAALVGGSLVDVQNHTTQLRLDATGASVNFGSISMIAQDGAGELYILTAVRGTAGTGIIHRIIPSGPQAPLADVGGQGGLPGADGQFDNNDFVVFIDLFFQNDPGADVGMQGGVPGADQLLDTNDFVVFIDSFFAGA